MRQIKNGFRHDSLQDTRSIQDILESIADGIKKGKIVFSDEDDKMTMEPEGLLHLKLKAVQEENRHQISIRISWQTEDKQTRQNKSLSVSS